VNLKLFRKRKVPKKPVLLLPSSIRTNRKDPRENGNSRKLLGVMVVTPSFSNRGEAAVYSPGRDRIERAVSYLKVSRVIGDVPVDIRRAFEGPADEITILLRTINEDPASFLRNIEKNKMVSNEVRAGFLDDVKDWALPYNQRYLTARDMFVWAPSRAIIPVKNERTHASLEGDIVTRKKYGPMLRSVIYRNLVDETAELKPDPLTGDDDPVSYAAPEQVRFYNNYYVLPDVDCAYAFWSGKLDVDNASQIAELGDLLIHAENVDRLLYCTAIIRVEVPANNGNPDFRTVARLISKLGKWHRVTWSGVEKAFRAFVPGSAHPPGWDKYFVYDSKTFFETLTQSLRLVGDAKGNYMVGENNDQALLLNYSIRPGVVYTGASKTGKSTLCAAHVAQITPNILWLPYNAVPNEAAPYWVKEFGGTIYPLNLPDAPDLIGYRGDNGKKRTTADFKKVQEEMHIEDAEDAKRVVREMEEQWYKHGKIVGLPLTFQLEAGNTVRLFNWYLNFLNQWRIAWAKWYTTTGQFSVVVADNINELVRADADDPALGEIPRHVSLESGNVLKKLVSNGRNSGILTRLLAHSEANLEYISPGFYKELGLEFRLMENDYTNADVYVPSEQRTMVKNLYIRLPVRMKELFERREPLEGDLTWTVRASSERS